MRRWQLLLLTTCLAAAPAMLSAAPLGEADASTSKEPVTLEAQEVGYDQKASMVVARGKVEVVQGERILHADLITYDQNANIVTAHGNVTLLNPDGNVFFADNVQLKNDMKQGIIHDFRARLSDNSLFAAREAEKINENVTELRKAVYSPCKLCEEDPTKAPLWQLKADKVRIDEADERITYKNARMEAYGVPVLYTPYFSHPTPDASNKSGLLTPTYSLSKGDLGAVATLPYYFYIAPDKDLTLTPMLMTEEAPVLSGEYRQLTDRGEFNFRGSITNPEKRDAEGNLIDGKDIRGHIDMHGKVVLNETWGWGFDIKRASDDTYLRRYRFSNENLLTSRAYVEGVRDRDYAIVQGLSFQGLNARDDPALTPLVTPLVDVQMETDPGWMGSRFNVKGNAMYLSRDIGADSGRISGSGGWRLPYMTRNGQIIELATQLRIDDYQVQNVGFSQNGIAQNFEGNVTRIVPEASLTWRYPFINRLSPETSLVVEPIAQAIVRPHGGNDPKIPNEDNQATEFSDTNLFSLNRFPGLDRVEEGTRFDYGVRGSLQRKNGDSADVMLGQSITPSGDNAFPLSNRPVDDFSDYVGRLALNFSPVEFSYRFRMDRESLTLQRQEIGSLLNWHPIMLSANYITLNNDPYLGDREELTLGSSLALNENWTLSADARKDLLDEGHMVYAGGGLAFHNECLSVLTTIGREYTRDRDIQPHTTFGLKLSLKNIN